MSDNVAPLADVKKLASQNVIPMSKLPAIPDSVPSMLTPPLVPFGTGCNKRHSHLMGATACRKEQNRLSHLCSGTVFAESANWHVQV